MKKNKIFIKLFTMTTCVVIFLLILQLFFQYFLLEDFYIYNKKKSVTKEILEIKKTLEDKELSEDKIEKLLEKSSIKNNMLTSISDLKGVKRYGLNENIKNSYIKVKNKNNKIFKVYLNSFINHNELINNLEINQRLTINGYSGYSDNSKNESFYPNYIIKGNKTFEKRDLNNTIIMPLEKGQLDLNIDDNIENIEIGEIDSGKDLIIINDENYIEAEKSNGSDEFLELEINSIKNKNIVGSITEIYLADKKDYSYDYQINKLSNEIFYYLSNKDRISNIVKNGKILNYSKIDRLTGIENMYFIYPMELKEKGPVLIFTTFSLQSIEEISGIMKKYFILILAIAVVLTLIVTYFYSKKFTDPLIHLNNITKKMTLLDFSEKCKISTNDEIESLSKNINEMSTELKITLEKLKESNSSLKEEIVYKEKTENFRKQFIANISHELKTPLTIMKGICEGIISGVYDYKDKKHLNSILDEINHMSKLIYDLLEVSRLGLKFNSIKKEKINLKDSFLIVYDKLKRLSDDKDLEVKYEFNDHIVIGDREKINRVIKNLYENAIQYTKNNGKIKVYDKKENDKILFIIENSPAKIDNKELTNLWEPFYRIEKSMNKKLGGSGLGLYIVKQILESHNSEYNLESEGELVRIYFTLKEKQY